MALLDGLRKSNDPLAALLAMSDSDLDLVAAEVAGMVQRGDTGEYYESADSIYIVEDWQPSRKLDQAYELLDSGDRRNRYVWACDIDGDGRYVELISQRLGVVRVYFEQAGSHARAVCALAILGLLQSGKDGAA